jgi:hypothetical protein
MLISLIGHEARGLATPRPAIHISPETFVIFWMDVAAARWRAVTVQQTRLLL